jgi:8-amino-7-oxononanoate synthase
MRDYQDELNNLKDTNSYRKIPEITEKRGKYVVVDGKQLLNFSSNDYLNLSTNEELAQEFVAEFSENPQFQFSSASARLLTGSSIEYNELEETV